MRLYFSDYFGIETGVLEEYGAFDISVVSDIPLFVDPFLLFTSEKPEYQALHHQILEYLEFLRSHAAADLDPALIQSWYRFKEVKQNWFGYTLFGNGGAGLGKDFAIALHGALGAIFTDFGQETITQDSHLEKLCLIRPGVGKDSISDFTTNLIKGLPPAVHRGLCKEAPWGRPMRDLCCATSRLRLCDRDVGDQVLLFAAGR